MYKANEQAAQLIVIVKKHLKSYHIKFTEVTANLNKSNCCCLYYLTFPIGDITIYEKRQHLPSKKEMYTGDHVHNNTHAFLYHSPTTFITLN